MAGSSRGMAVVGILIGLGAAGALIWNEWVLARSFAAIDEAAASLAVGGGGVIHLTGEARASAPARDPAFGLAATALRLDRTAETYQWQEHREGSGDNKVLRYRRVWSADLIPSRRFEQRTTHVNPTRLRLASARFVGGMVEVAGRPLAPALVDLLPATRELRFDRQGPVTAEGLNFRREDDWLYSGDPAAPRTGDVRVRFAAAPEGVVSIVAAEAGGELEGWRARGGGEVALAAYGEVPPETLLEGSAREGWRGAWVLRGFAGLAMTIAAMFWLPALAARLGDPALLRGGRRIGAMLLLGVSAAVAACAIGWLGARLLLIAGGA